VNFQRQFSDIGRILGVFKGYSKYNRYPCGIKAPSLGTGKVLFEYIDILQALYDYCMWYTLLTNIWQKNNEIYVALLGLNRSILIIPFKAHNAQY